MTDQKHNPSMAYNNSYIRNLAGVIFLLSALIITCVICFNLGTPIKIETPIILVAASLFTLLPFKSKPTIKTIQKVTLIYLFAVLVNQLALNYYSYSGLSFNVNLSYSLIPLLLCAAGFFIKTSSGSTEDVTYKDVLCGWLLSFGLIIIHMLLLTILLKKFYNYGFEHNLITLGNLSLYFLLFIFLWKKLDNIRLKQCFGLILAIFCAFFL